MADDRFNWSDFVANLPLIVVADVLRRMAPAKPLDGPYGFARTGQAAQCQECGLVVSCDLYYFGGVLLCGDCRYWRRHGVPPTHESGVCGRGLVRRGRETLLGDEGGSETLGRFKHLWINSKREMPILDSWIEDCSASLK